MAVCAEARGRIRGPAPDTSPPPSGSLRAHARVSAGGMAVAMAQVTPRLPIASVGGKRPVAKISSSDWLRIEAAYGHRLSTQLRKSICQQTSIYLVRAQAEKPAKPLADALKYLKAIQKASTAFSRAFDLPCEADARRYANILLKRQFSDARLKISNSSDSLHSLKGVITSFVVACAQAEDQLLRDKPRGFRPGSFWNDWIRNLRWLKVHGERPAALMTIILVRAPFHLLTRCHGHTGR
jgi:hypothetical protein